MEKHSSPLGSIIHSVLVPSLAKIGRQLTEGLPSAGSVHKHNFSELKINNSFCSSHFSGALGSSKW